MSPTLRRVAQVGAFLVPTLPAPLEEPTDSTVLTQLPEARERLARDPLTVMEGLPWLTVGGGAVVSHENWARYQVLRVPVLAVHGTSDKSTDPTGSRDFIQRVASRDKTLHLIPDGRHAPLDDLGQDETRQVLLTWLAQRLPARR